MKITLKQHYNDFYESFKKEDWYGLDMVLKALKQEVNQDIGAIVIRMGMIPPILSLLTDSSSTLPCVQNNALWVLANLTAGSTEDVIKLVEMGIIPILVRFFEENDDELLDNVMWALANIAGEDDPKYRTEILGFQVLPFIEKNFKGAAKKLSIVRTATWLVKNLLRAPLAVPVDEVLVILPFLVHCSSLDPNALLSLISLYETQDERIFQEVRNPEVVLKLIQKARSPEGEFDLKFLRVCDYLEKNDIDSVQNFDNNDLKTLKDLLNHKNDLIRLKSCTLLSFLLFRPICDSEYVFIHEIMPRIIELASDDGPKTREQAINCLTNFVRASKVTDSEVQYLVSQGLMTVLLANLTDHNNITLISKSLEAISEILKHGELSRKDLSKPNAYSLLIEKSQFGSLLKDLIIGHKEVTIRELASDILSRYWSKVF